MIDDPDGDDDTIVKFTYDALGRRIKKEIYDDGSLDETVRFIYSGQNVIEEYVDDSGWVLEAEYVHGIGIDNVLTIERDSSRWYYHHDGLGSVTELTDSNGDLDQAYEYDAWGMPTIYDPAETTILNPYMYTGRRWDPEINLYYYRARYYDPQHGRFTQPDPTGYTDGPNLYIYVACAPTWAIDPTGRWTEAKALKVLRRKITDFRGKKYEYAADLLQHFIDKKGPAAYVATKANEDEIAADPDFRSKMLELIGDELSRQGAGLPTKTERLAFVTSSPLLSISKKMRWSGRRMFYTFGAVNVHVVGFADLSHRPHAKWRKWAESTNEDTFSKAFNWKGWFFVELVDYYTFDVSKGKAFAAKLRARSYAAARFLELKCGYKPFDNIANLKVFLGVRWK